ncbi:hypothetical protein PDJAM_G00262370 [Pangasius djambal]|nr:hypothetical protein [Pangasius djambal]
MGGVRLICYSVSPCCSSVSVSCLLQNRFTAVELDDGGNCTESTAICSRPIALTGKPTVDIAVKGYGVWGVKATSV